METYVACKELGQAIGPIFLTQYNKIIERCSDQILDSSREDSLFFEKYQ